MSTYTAHQMKQTIAYAPPREAHALLNIVNSGLCTLSSFARVNFFWSGPGLHRGIKTYMLNHMHVTIVEWLGPRHKKSP